MAKKKVFPTKIDEALITELGELSKKLGVSRNGLAELILTSGVIQVSAVIQQGLNPVFMVRTGNTSTDPNVLAIIAALQYPVMVISNPRPNESEEDFEARKKRFEEEREKNRREQPEGPRIGHMDTDEKM